MTKHRFSMAFWMVYLLLVRSLGLELDAQQTTGWAITTAPTNDWRAIAISADGSRLAAAASDNPGDGLI